MRSNSSNSVAIGRPLARRWLVRKKKKRSTTRASPFTSAPSPNERQVCFGLGFQYCMGYSYHNPSVFRVLSSLLVRSVALACKRGLSVIEKILVRLEPELTERRAVGNEADEAANKSGKGGQRDKHHSQITVSRDLLSKVPSF